MTPTSDDSSDRDSTKSTKFGINKQEVNVQVHVDGEQISDKLLYRSTSDDGNAIGDIKNIEEILNEFNKTVEEERQKLKRTFDRQMSSLDQTDKNVIETVHNLHPGPYAHMVHQIKNGENITGFDLTMIKDQNGQTLLHFAAAKLQEKSTFYKMMSQMEHLVSERDFQYRTPRDITVSNGIKDNLQTIDKYILDSFINGNVKFIRTLCHEGYENLLNIVDSEGQDVVALLKKHNVIKMIDLIQDLAQFIVSIKNTTFYHVQCLV